MSKWFAIKSFLAVLVSGMVLGTEALADTNVLVTVFPQSAAVNDSLTYTIWITNTLGFRIANLNVVDTLPSSVQFLSATNDSGTTSSSGGVVTFHIAFLEISSVASMTITGQPTVVGTISNSVTITAANATMQPIGLISQVVPQSSDLALTLIAPSSPVFVNDWIAYTVMVSNRGPGSASSSVLSNAFSAPVLLQGVSPANNGSTFTGTNLVLNIDALGSGAVATFQVRIQPTNAGSLTLYANALAPSGQDANTNNNTSAFTLNVATPVLGQLQTSVAPQLFNPQTGLIEQTITLKNTSSSNADSARVIVTNYPYRLYNAVGTNNGNPFVVFAGLLLPNESTNLVLEFFNPTRLTDAGPGLVAYAITNANQSVPAGSNPVTPLKIDLSAGRVLIEFPSVAGQAYWIRYSDDVSFTNAHRAEPAITAPANRVQWIDDGPPKTISPPSSSANRFYQVFQQ